MPEDPMQAMAAMMMNQRQSQFTQIMRMYTSLPGELQENFLSEMNEDPTFQGLKKQFWGNLTIPVTNLTKQQQEVNAVRAKTASLKDMHAQMQASSKLGIPAMENQLGIDKINAQRDNLIGRFSEEADYRQAVNKEAITDAVNRMAAQDAYSQAPETLEKRAQAENYANAAAYPMQRTRFEQVLSDRRATQESDENMGQQSFYNPINQSIVEQQRDADFNQTRRLRNAEGADARDKLRITTTIGDLSDKIKNSGDPVTRRYGPFINMTQMNKEFQLEAMDMEALGMSPEERLKDIEDMKEGILVLLQNADASDATTVWVKGRETTVGLLKSRLTNKFPSLTSIYTNPTLKPGKR